MLVAILYYAFIVLCVVQSFYPLFMIMAMIVRQSRLLMPFFSPVDKSSKKHGGNLVAEVLKAHGIGHIFTLPGGHVSPILTAAEQLKIRVVDVRHEATAVFAADAISRLTGRPGVAVVTAGPGLTNTITAIKNAQMAESPVVVMAGAAATLLRGRGSLQDIEQLELLKTVTKKTFTISAVRDIVPTLREAFRSAASDLPGPVMVEFPVDTLYPYDITAAQFASMKKKKPTGLMQKITQIYSQYALDSIFAGAWQEHRDCSPHPIVCKQASASDVRQISDWICHAQQPLIIIGTQATFRPYGPDQVADCIKQLGAPVYLNGGARGLLGSDSYPLQFIHSRSEAIREADFVLLLGAQCDFRLGYGRVFNARTKVVSINRSGKNARLNSPIFWKPAKAIECDVGKFVVDLVQNISNSIDSKSSSELKFDDMKKSSPNGHTSDDLGLKLLKNIDKKWLNELKQRDEKRNKAIANLSNAPVRGNRDAFPLPGTIHSETHDEGLDKKLINPLKVIMSVQNAFNTNIGSESEGKKSASPTIIADGGDFVATASYILRPNGPGRWLDPGPFGTLGCGAGFALASKLLYPDRPVVCIMGDGSFGYALAELDTFVRHKCNVMFVIGNDACWTQIAREQLPMLGSSVSCNLAYTDYDKIGRAFGTYGARIDYSSLFSDNNSTVSNEQKEKYLFDQMIEARRQLEQKQTSVVINAIIGNTNFRDGSISI